MGAAPFGTNGDVHTLTRWDPDGAGPLPELLVIGGQFTIAGSAIADRVALFDAATSQWSALPPLPAPLGYPVNCAVAMPNGDLVVGIATVTFGALAFRWNGVAWTPLGSGSGSGSLQDLCVMQNGDLLAGGSFTLGGVTMRLARWNGTTWAPYAGDAGGTVNDLLVTPAGDLIVTGAFASVGGGVPAASVARWNGVAWTALGTGFTFAISTASTGHRLCQTQSGDVFASVTFNVAGYPFPLVMRWDGNAWSSIGNTSSHLGSVDSLAHDPTTDAILVAGSNWNRNRIEAWNGSAWTPITSDFSSGTVRCIQRLGNGSIAVGGSFGGLNSTTNLAMWTNGQWVAPGVQLGSIHRLVALGEDGAVGACFPALSATGHYLVRWQSGSWQPLDPNPNSHVAALLALPGGHLIAGGDFSAAGSVLLNHIARWDGTSWSPLGAGCNGGISALARLSNGEIVAAGLFTSAGGIAANGIARWDGAAWWPLGSGISGGYADHLVVLPDGSVVAIGDFTSAGGIAVNRVARWNGTAWSAMGSGFTGPCYSAALVPHRGIVLGGVFPSGPFLNWNGSSWQPLPPTTGHYGLAVVGLPDGDVLAGIMTLGPNGQFLLKRLDGATWSDVSTLNGGVSALAATTSGVLVAGGFSTIGSLVADRIARFGSSCPATAVTTGAACASSGGANTIAATSLPWLGGTLVTEGSGLPTTAIVAIVRGFAPASVPLATVLPQGVPGCTLHVTPDLLDAMVTTTGTATASVPIPPTVSLIGLGFGEQWVPLELAPGGAITAATATNLLSVTIGVL